MGSKHTLGELNNLSREELLTIILGMQGQLDALNENIEKLIEQVRLANQQRFGRHTETMASIEGQLSFFDEADALYNPLVQEPDPDEILPKKQRRKNPRGNGKRTKRISRKMSYQPTRYLKRYWMLSTVKATGNRCPVKPINV